MSADTSITAECYTATSRHAEKFDPYRVYVPLDASLMLDQPCWVTGGAAPGCDGGLDMAVFEVAAMPQVPINLTSGISLVGWKLHIASVKSTFEGKDTGVMQNELWLTSKLGLQFGGNLMKNLDLTGSVNCSGIYLSGKATRVRNCQGITYA